MDNKYKIISAWFSLMKFSFFPIILEYSIVNINLHWYMK